MTKQQLLTNQKEAVKNRLICLEMFETIESNRKKMLVDNYTYWTQEDMKCTIALSNFRETDIPNPIMAQYGK